MRQLKLLYIAWPLPASLHEKYVELTASSMLFVRKMLNSCNRLIDFTQHNSHTNTSCICSVYVLVLEII